MGENDQRGPGPGEGGVFGNLPSSRPGTRSPRRERAGGEPEAVEREPELVQPEPVEPEPVVAAEPPVDERPAPEPEPDDPQGAQHGGGLEDLAWAGIAAAAEAATIGVRLASRAMEALRGSGERR